MPTHTPPQAAQVTSIIDGDTIDVTIDGATYRVRYIGMDTPERGQPFFSEATAKNRELVAGQVVTLVKDVSETDRFGRLLRYVYVGDVFVNHELVATGYAVIATFPPDVACVDTFRQAEQAARQAGAGLWAPMPTAAVAVLATAAPTQPQTGGGFTVVSLTSPVRVNANASLVIQTTAGASCNLAYTTPAGTTSHAQGLGPKTADASGRCAWSWRIGSNTLSGIGTLRVTAAGVAQSMPIEIAP